MKIYKVGDKSKAVCSFCKEMVSTTFKVKSVPLSGSKGKVRDILAGVCDRCDRVVSIPQQSVPRIKETLGRKKRAVEVRLPQHLSDVLFFACHQTGISGSDDQTGQLIRYYIHRIKNSSSLDKRLQRHLASELAEGSASSRLSLKLDEHLYQSFRRILKRTKLSASDLIRAIALQVKEDIIDQKDKETFDRVKELLEVA